MTAMTNTRQFMTTSEVAELLRLPSETLRYWRYMGKGPKSFKVGRRVLYAVEDVQAFIAEARSNPVGMSTTDPI